MTTVGDLTGTRLYLDTNVFIYFVEGHSRFRVALDSLFKAHEDKKVSLCTSELTLAEVLVKPFVDFNEAAIERYQELLSPQSQLEVLPIDRNLLIASARVRATWGGKTFDAIHIATALHAEADFFISEDAKVRGPPTLTFLRLSELVCGPQDGMSK